MTMTDDEKRQQKLTLMMEFDEAESNLAHLREKAGRIGKDMLEVGQWLGYMSPGELPDTEFRKKENSQRNSLIRASLGKYRSAMAFDEALALMDEIAKAEKQVESIAIRKSALGMK